MNQKMISQYLLAISFFLACMACNQDEKKEEEKKADSSSTAVKEITPPPTAELSIDATTHAPNLYKLMSDSLGIRVVLATYKPGDSSVMHSHPDNAFYTIAGGKGEFIDKDGKKTEMELKTGMSNINSYQMHSVKNIGKSTMKVLLVEVNRPKEIVSSDPATDATKVAGNNYKLVMDSLGIRIIEVNYKPGQVSAFHAHPDYAVYVVEGGSAVLTDKDGKKNANVVKTGAAWINGADAHSGKNTGSKSFKLILVEVNRPRK